LTDNLGVPLSVGDLVVYRAAQRIRLGRVEAVGGTYAKITALEVNAVSISRSGSDIVRVHESTLAMVKLHGKKKLREDRV